VTKTSAKRGIGDLGTFNAYRRLSRPRRRAIIAVGFASQGKQAKDRGLDYARPNLLPESSLQRDF